MTSLVDIFVWRGYGLLQSSIIWVIFKTMITLTLSTWFPLRLTPNSSPILHIWFQSENQRTNWLFTSRKYISKCYICIAIRIKFFRLIFKAKHMHYTHFSVLMWNSRRDRLRYTTYIVVLRIFGNEFCCVRMFTWAGVLNFVLPLSSCPCISVYAFQRKIRFIPNVSMDIESA